MALMMASLLGLALLPGLTPPPSSLSYMRPQPRCAVNRRWGQAVVMQYADEGSGYVRREGDDAPIDVLRVEELIAERSDLRMARDYEGADEVRNELRGMGVTVHDREMEGFVGAGNRDRCGGGGGYGGGNGGYGQQQSSFGYVRRAGDDGPIDVARVEELIAERSDLRMARDYEGADAVRDELRGMGVTVHDREMEWFVGRGGSGARSGYDSGSGGGRYNDGGGERRSFRTPQDFGPDGHDYVRDERDASELPDGALEEINDLLARRLEAKMKRAFNTADGLKDQLRAFGVSVDDREKVWRYAPVVPRVFGPDGHDYTRAEDDSTELGEDQLARINTLLKQRMEAKMARRFEEADGYHEELKSLNVFLNDKLKGWRADGGMFPTHARIDGDGDVEGAEPVDEQAVNGLLADRSLARKDQDYDAADAIVARLRDEFSVVLDDKRGTWRRVMMVGGYFQVGPRVDVALVEQVRRLVHGRSQRAVEPTCMLRPVGRFTLLRSSSRAVHLPLTATTTQLSAPQTLHSALSRLA